PEGRYEIFPPRHTAPVMESMALRPERGVLSLPMPPGGVTASRCLDSRTVRLSVWPGGVTPAQSGARCRCPRARTAPPPARPAHRAAHDGRRCVGIARRLLPARAGQWQSPAGAGRATATQVDGVTRRAEPDPRAAPRLPARPRDVPPAAPPPAPGRAAARPGPPPATESARWSVPACRDA